MYLNTKISDRRPVETVSMLTEEFPGHVDIPRMKAGKLGGVFMSVWIPCEENVEFMNPDTVSHCPISAGPTVELISGTEGCHGAD
jgi:hypothetical protein